MKIYTSLLLDALRADQSSSDDEFEELFELEFDEDLYLELEFELEFLDGLELEFFDESLFEFN